MFLFFFVVFFFAAVAVVFCFVVDFYWLRTRLRSPRKRRPFPPSLFTRERASSFRSFFFFFSFFFFALNRPRTLFTGFLVLFLFDILIGFLIGEIDDPVLVVGDATATPIVRAATTTSTTTTTATTFSLSSVWDWPFFFCVFFFQFCF